MLSLVLQSLSTFAPICNPTACPWGEKAFKGYLGVEKAALEKYDATSLVKKYHGTKTTILVDQLIVFRVTRTSSTKRSSLCRKILKRRARVQRCLWRFAFCPAMTTRTSSLPLLLKSIFNITSKYLDHVEL
uniref:S-formylglutathione hydrolase n=1 Tax=Physcomitrium patens TaxID=3218 RepID=A0A2K1L7L7_PHYPA|nr:hypothetical protein PHYPA_000463 [Physcomitrium patens]